MMRVLTVCLCMSLAACQAKSDDSLPAVRLVYSPALDSACALLRGGRIQPAWREELLARMEEFASLWRDAGPAMMAQAETLTGIRFPDDKVTVRLTLCDLPSQSFWGISVNMRFALHSFTETPVPLRYKMDTLFHERLHPYLAGHLPEHSPLMAAYADEPARVRNHLHLLALQQEVLRSLNETQALQSVIDTDSQLPGGLYRRAWEIVNSPDTGSAAWVAELTPSAAAR